MKQWVYLFVAIISEVIGTTALKSSNGFTNLIPCAIVVTGYAISFYFLSLTLKTMPVGTAYAVWSGAGVSIIALVGWIFFKQSLDFPAIIGIIFIIIGVVILNLFSNSVSH